MTIPTFDATLPVDTLVAPTATFQWAEVAYQSSLLDAATAKLMDDLENGGYGIEPADEAALWDRARAREVEAAQGQVEEIFRLAAARGWSQPPGDTLVAAQRAMQESADKVSSFSRDIALKRSEMYVENRKFTITEVRGFETVLINYHNAVMERSLNAAKAVVELGISIFNATVQRFNASLEAYKAESVAFEQRVRAVLSQAEIYRTTMEGKRIELDSQRAQVEIYRGQLAGVQAVSDLYRSRVEARRVLSEIQRLKIEGFRAQVEGYVASVQARQAQAQIYTSTVQGQTARVQAFEAQARAFSAQADGARARSDALVGKARADAERVNALVRAYEAKVSAFRARFDAIAEQIRALISRYGVDAQVFATRGNVYSEAARVGVTQAQVESSLRFKALDIVIENAKMHLEALTRTANVKNATSNVMGSYITQVVAASISALQTISGVTAQKSS
jgi:hypothetical protein